MTPTSTQNPHSHAPLPPIHNIYTGYMVLEQATRTPIFSSLTSMYSSYAFTWSKKKDGNLRMRVYWE